MTYQEFYEKLIDLGINIDDTFGKKTKTQYQPDHSCPRQIVVEKGRDAIVQETEIGGVFNGNCWRETTPIYEKTISEEKIEFSDLDKILTNIYPNISYLQYKKLLNDVVHEENKSVGEYYGNYTDYHLFYIYVEDLYNYLKNLEQSDN